MGFIYDTYDWAKEGRRYNIPWCCGLRFGFHASRPKPLGKINPKLCAFLGSLGLRMAYARHDGRGYVPCEYHLLKWLLTGDTGYRDLQPPENLGIFKG